MNGSPAARLRAFAFRRSAGAAPLATWGAIVLAAFLVATLGRGYEARASEAALHPSEDMVGAVRVYTATQSDTLLDVARRFGLGYVEIVAANPGVDPWLPGAGTRLVLPTAHLLPSTKREGIVINLGEQRLYYFPAPGAKPLSFPIGIGQQGWNTPLGHTRIVRKRANPTWYPPESIRAEKPDLPKVVPPGPNNPLGRYALYLGWPSYLVHGTNMPWAVGRRVSHGCIRLYPEDIERLFDMVAVGTPVEVIDQPVKVGWSNGELYLEVHPERAQLDVVESTGHVLPRARDDIADVLYRIRVAAGKAAHRIDWRVVRKALAQRNGLPVRITRMQASG